MSDTKLVSPLLDDFTLGAPMSNHSGICCCPAVKENSDNKYIVKIIAVPASQVQLDALLVTGAYKDPAAALDYFRNQADDIAVEADLLQKLSKLEGFVSYEGWQVAPMKKNRLGYHIYLVSDFRRSLERMIRRQPITHLEAVNMGLDICSALALCRRAGFIYADLKPTNIFVGEDKTFRIGDLGFFAMDSLKYTSLPEKYCSDYSAPEIKDPMNTLNDTADTYALGMILYRIFNGGKVPQVSSENGAPLPAPAHADAGMTEIILKACAPQVEDRWKDPTEMGQALVNYMQSSTINDVPISEMAPTEASDSEAAAPVSQETVRFVPGQAEDAPAAEPVELDKTILAPESFREAVEAETAAEETAPVEEEAPAEVDPVSEESVEVPVEEPADDALFAETEAEEAPAVEPEAAEEVPAAEEQPEEPETDFDLDDELQSVNDLLKPSQDTPARKPLKPTVAPTPVVMGKKKRKKVNLVKVLLSIIAVLVLVAVGFCGYSFYRYIYLQNVDSISVTGTQDEMVVTLKTETADELLKVACTDTFGNTRREQVTDGKAVFTDLSPAALYKISVEVSGFHKLTGQISDVFTTESQTEIISIGAVTGPEDGSVLLTLTVHGHEPDTWLVTCTADGEENVIKESFSGHSGTIKGLTVGKEYTITVSCDEDIEMMGNNTTTFVASTVVSAGNLAVVSRINGELTVAWDSPYAVEEWTVRCYSDGYDETQKVTSTVAIFTGTETSKAYNIEVTASGMTQPTRTTVSANPVTITALNVDDSKDQELNIKWEFDGEAPKEGWLLLYTMDGNEISNVVKCSKPTAQISPRVPGATYQFTIQTTDDTSVFNGVHNYNCPNGAEFVGHALSASKISAKLLETPTDDKWRADTIDKSVYTNHFNLGQKISMVLEAGISFYLEHEDINVLFVIRDSNGNVIPNLIEQIRCDWHDLWVDNDYHYGELNVPNAPALAGSYQVDVYFNGFFAASAEFTES